MICGETNILPPNQMKNKKKIGPKGTKIQAKSFEGENAFGHDQIIDGEKGWADFNKS